MLQVLPIRETEEWSDKPSPLASNDMTIDDATEVVSSWLFRVLPFLNQRDANLYARRLVVGGFCSEDKLNHQLTRNDLAFMAPTHRIGVCAYLNLGRREQEEVKTKENLSVKKVVSFDTGDADTTCSYRNHADGELATEEDKQHLTSFVYLVLKQLRIYHFPELDKISRFGGFCDKISGVQCIHCEQAGNPTRFFANDTEMFVPERGKAAEHVQKCQRCPPETRAALEECRERYYEELVQLPPGSQLDFLRRLTMQSQARDRNTDGSGARRHGRGSTRPNGSVSGNTRLSTADTYNARASESSNGRGRRLPIAVSGGSDPTFLSPTLRGMYGDDDDGEFQRGAMNDAMTQYSNRDVEVACPVADSPIAHSPPEVLDVADESDKIEGGENDSSAPMQQNFDMDDDSWTAEKEVHNATAEEGEVPCKLEARATPTPDVSQVLPCMNTNGVSTIVESCEGESFSITSRSSTAKRGGKAFGEKFKSPSPMDAVSSMGERRANTSETEEGKKSAKNASGPRQGRRSCFCGELRWTRFVGFSDWRRVSVEPTEPESGK